MEHMVVVHMKDGALHKGVTHDFDPAEDHFYILPAEGGGVPLRIHIEEMKALFYVRDYVGNRDFVSRKQFDEAKRSGQRAILTFHDGETIWGTVPEYSQEGRGFYFFPIDEEDNNIRIYVMRSSLKEMRLVP